MPLWRVTLSVNDRMGWSVRTEQIVRAINKVAALLRAENNVRAVMADVVGDRMPGIYVIGIAADMCAPASASRVAAA